MKSDRGQDAMTVAEADRDLLVLRVIGRAHQTLDVLAVEHEPASLARAAEPGDLVCRGVYDEGRPLAMAVDRAEGAQAEGRP